MRQDQQLMMNGFNTKEEDDEDIIEEADRRSKFMMKGGSHSIQKVLRGVRKECTVLKVLGSYPADRRTIDR